MFFTKLRQCYIDNPQLGEYNLRAKAMANYKSNIPKKIPIGGPGQMQVYQADGTPRGPQLLNC
eukprot:JP448952.1.p2 GENE.JP448952.1~~JP448952.1.p2  ORF type:complete len:63 (+),score=28.34 JP448952.1:27-215(+)